MTTVYKMPLFPTNRRPPRRLTGLGTAHRGGQNWSLGVRSIRSVLLLAREHAPPCATAVTLADQVIDHIDELKPRDVAVLAVAFGILLRASRN